MIVKTWEKLEKKKTENDTKSKIHPIHVKTLRIYDTLNNEKAQILIEMIETKINTKNFYDTSILQYKDSIYYFKRIYEEIAGG